MALKLAVAVLACIGSGAVAQHLPLPELPYAYDALEPYIDEATMRTHHLKHHQTYTDNTNIVLGKLRESPEYKHLAKMGIDVLLTKLDQLEEDDRRMLRNHGGGYVNHDLFFKIMSPAGGAKTVSPDGPLMAAIENTFGSLENFVTEFTGRAMSLFGSGWVWLYLDGSGAGGEGGEGDEPRGPVLVVTTTSNQDTPAMIEGNYPILALDVWEHAYYLKHKNNRAQYIQDWWHVVNWPKVEQLYTEALAKLQKRKGTDKDEL